MKNKRIISFIILVIVLVSIIGGITYAYLQDTATRTNAFVPAAVRITIDEPGFVNNSVSLAADVASHKPVFIRNEAFALDGRPGTDAYIRVALVPIWRHSDGTGTGLPIANVTLTLATNAAAAWLSGSDGYYYYKYPVAPGTSTAQLLQSVSWSLTGNSLRDSDYQASKLEVQVLADAIQSETDAVETAWTRVSIDGDGNLVLN